VKSNVSDPDNAQHEHQNDHRAQLSSHQDPPEVPRQISQEKNIRQDPALIAEQSGKKPIRQNHYGDCHELHNDTDCRVNRQQPGTEA